MTSMINVRPRPYHIPAKEAKALADWFLRKYIEPYVKDEQPTFIDISFNKKIDTLGLCSDEQDNEYLVEVNPINGYNHMMKTLCHELIHVKQYRLGEMKAVTGGTKWKKKKYNLSTPYHDCPWEVEAFKLEGRIWGIWQRTIEGRCFLR